MSKVTIKEIAQIANVSTASVSMVLNNKPCRISSETKEKIIKIAQDLNYIPNQTSEFFLPPATKNIGMLIPDANNLFFNQLTSGVEKYAYHMGYGTLHGNVENSAKRCLEYTEFLISKNVDGIIIVPPDDIDRSGNNKRLLEIFSKAKTPKVLLDRAVRDLFCDFVTMDNQYGGFLATEYLIKHGHVKIGCITGPLDSYCAKKRFLGFKEALSNHGLHRSMDNFYEGNFDFESGIIGGKLLKEKGVTAIFAENDMMAFGVYQYARENSLDIPRDMSVIGFDDVYMGNILVPSLTSINQPAELMGKRACEILFNRIKGLYKFGPKDYFYTPAIAERESVGSVT